MQKKSEKNNTLNDKKSVKSNKNKQQNKYIHNIKNLLQSIHKCISDILLKISFKHIKSDAKQIHISKEGKTTIILMLTATMVSLVVFGLCFLTALLLFTSLIVVYFFRDPTRITPDKNDVIISPCDGKILNIETANLPEEIGSIDGKEYTKISIFINLMDVHIQRIPVNCKVKQIEYIKGTFINATLDKANKDNERNIVVFERDNGDNICVVQISGFISRRIVCNIEKDQICNIGDKYGMIKFGSRVEIYLPKNYKINVLAGQRVVCGETVIASF